MPIGEIVPNATRFVLRFVNQKIRKPTLRVLTLEIIGKTENLDDESCLSRIGLHRSFGDCGGITALLSRRTTLDVVSRLFCCELLLRAFRLVVAFVVCMVAGMVVMPVATARVTDRRSHTLTGRATNIPVIVIIGWYTSVIQSNRQGWNQSSICVSNESIIIL